MDDKNRILESQIREIYGRVIYTHKTHEKCAEILKKKHDFIKVVEIALSAFTTTSLLFILSSENRNWEIIAAILSTLLLGINLYFKNYNLQELIEKHKRAALDILEIREVLLSLLVDLKIGNKSISKLQSVRDTCNKRLLKVYRGSPKTTSKAYDKASKALQENEEFTFTDGEIDLFLPESLRTT